jgi:alpha-galactosidase
MKCIFQRSLTPAMVRLIALTMFACSTIAQATDQARLTRDKDISLRNEFVSVLYHRRSGTMDIVWQDGHKLLGLASSAVLEDGSSLTTTAYAQHDLDKFSDNVSAGASVGTLPAHEYTIRSAAPGMPAFLQHIWLYDGKPWIAIEAELGPGASAIGTRHFDAVVLKGASAVQIDGSQSLRVLHVPFDNDMWFRYNSFAVADMKASQVYTSDEVTAIYDNVTRHSLILGSIAHDIWKTAIEVHATDGHLTGLDIYGGISSPTGVRTDTHDTVEHGLVKGAQVISPRVFLGSFADWRDGLEAYGAANAALHPPLKWADGAPMGWNSWAAYAEKIDEHRYLGSAAFVRDVLVPQGFGRKKVVYINLDAFWSKLDAVQLADAVTNIKAMHGADGVHFEPGTYTVLWRGFTSILRSRQESKPTTWV